ncbi:hypothetical protein GCM10010124_17760 [Pilimelia terevasa]|uniref:Uncharacterized protein n=1 Tax=Pilimelia terevasa TaxID=53372 RepID=A0A8J3BP56_9ACTN|nr:RICIN domain-containing protein [Pilimelia terevasa]GGK25643.1 hypothetical protein GCM10010124_17760 [Pilimelia terevasa]
MPARRKTARPVPVRPRRRRGPRLSRGRVAVTAAIAAVGLGLGVAPDLVDVRLGAPRPVGAAPPDNPRLGLVYQELTPADDDAPCVGGYEVTDRRTCTLGPDPAPAGVDLGATVPPAGAVAPAPALPTRDDGPPPRARDLLREAGAVAVDDTLPGLAPAHRFHLREGVVCQADGRSDPRVQLLYLYPEGASSQAARYRDSIRGWAVAAQERTRGADAPVRYATTGDCRPDVREVGLPAAALGTFTGTVAALRERGFARGDRAYLAFADAHVYCGISTHGPDPRRPSPTFARVDAGCWGEDTTARQLDRLLGDPREPTGGASAGSPFLVRGNAEAAADVTPVLPAAAPPAAAPTPQPSASLPSPPPGPAPTRTATPTPTPTPAAPTAPAAGTGRPLRAAAESASAVTLTWPAAGRAANYTVVVDDRPVGTLGAPAARLVGLRPARAYDVRVWIAGAGGALRPHTDAQRVRTGVPADAAGAVTLRDALTGGAVELAAGRGGAPAVLGPPDTTAGQSWQTRPAGGDEVQFVAADGRCLAPRGGVAAGAVLASTACDGSRAQRWRLRRTPAGLAVTSAAAGDLVVGVARPRFGEAHLLTLQRDREFRSQRWHALPAAD